MINKKLNQDQLNAVVTNDKPLRIVAGAGTGKTTVITEKISYLINDMHLDAKRILAITFTNKAATEMRNRVGKVISHDTSLPIIRTYHSFCSWFLRREIEVLKLGFKKDFIILDTDDQKKLIKKFVKESNFLGNEYSGVKLIKMFSNWQMQKMTIEELKNSIVDDDTFTANTIGIYQKYLIYKNDNNVLDFNDLILKTEKILSTYDEVAQRWVSYFDYILVDEFQDTSYYQYNIIKILSQKKQNLCVVGDPDQTIYSWRGANVDIILNLAKDYPGLETITLKENYRSPQKILEVANKLIKNNKIRLDKELFSSKNNDLPILYYQAFSAEDEARWTINEINKLQQKGVPLADIVILYRVNSLSLYLEQALIKSNMKYRVIGNINFFARQEIKDLISYLWVVVSGHDFYLERIINVPRRSIGPKSWKKITDFANQKNISYFEAIMNNLTDIGLSNNCVNQITKLIDVVSAAKKSLETKDVKKFMTIVEKLYLDSGYQNYLTILDEKQLVTGSRKDNVKELFQFFQNNFNVIAEHNSNSLLENLKDVLSDISLLSNTNEDSDNEDSIRLMTVHNAKGLEFPYVFLIGLNEEIMPHALSLPLNLEEERRIAYVAITRAQKQIFIASATRFAFDKVNTPLPVSRFINEIKPLLTIAVAEPVTKFSINDSKEFVDKRVENYHSNNRDFVIDDIVEHKVFGIGTIVKIDDDIITISFKYNHGIKSFLKNHKSIKKIIK